MGSINATIGGVAGKNPLGIGVALASNTTYYFTTMHQRGFTGGVYPANWFYIECEYGWTKFLFQLVAGNASAGSITINATMDQNSAQNITTNGSLWFEEIPSPSSSTGAGWTNPLTTVAGARLFYVNAGPFCAFNAVVSSAYNGTSGYLLVGATP